MYIRSLGEIPQFVKKRIERNLVECFTFNDSIDIDAALLYEHGIDIPLHLEDFLQCLDVIIFALDFYPVSVAELSRIF